MDKRCGKCDELLITLETGKLSCPVCDPPIIAQKISNQSTNSESASSKPSPADPPKLSKTAQNRTAPNDSISSDPVTSEQPTDQGKSLFSPAASNKIEAPPVAQPPISSVPVAKPPLAEPPIAESPSAMSSVENQIAKRSPNQLDDRAGLPPQADRTSTVNAPIAPPIAEPDDAPPIIEPVLESTIAENERVLLPDGKGGFVEASERTTHIEYRGSKIALSSMKRDEREATRGLKNFMVVTFCVVFLLILMLVLNWLQSPAS